MFKSHQIHKGKKKSHLGLKTGSASNTMSKYINAIFSLLGCPSLSSWSLCSKISLLKDLLQKKPLGNGKHYSNIKIPQLYTRERCDSSKCLHLIGYKDMCWKRWRFL